MINILQQEKQETLFFEDRMTTYSNIIICVVKQIIKSKASPRFKALIRMTINTGPAIGFCRYLELTGELVL